MNNFKYFDENNIEVSSEYLDDIKISSITFELNNEKNNEVIIKYFDENNIKVSSITYEKNIVKDANYYKDFIPYNYEKNNNKKKL